MTMKNQLEVIINCQQAQLKVVVHGYNLLVCVCVCVVLCVQGRCKVDKVTTKHSKCAYSATSYLATADKCMALSRTATSHASY